MVMFLKIRFFYQCDSLRRLILYIASAVCIDIIQLCIFFYVVPVLHRFLHKNPQALYVVLLYFSLYLHVVTRKPVHLLQLLRNLKHKNN